MTRICFLLILCSTLLSLPNLPAAGSSQPDSVFFYAGNQDTVDNQMLYNGRAWRNLYPKVIGDQFLFTKEFMPGTVTIDGKQFPGMPIKYDIYNDEILTINNRGIIIQLNKEMIDQFSFNFNNIVYRFRRLIPDSVNLLTGYVDVLYDGKVSLFVKHKKEILLLAVEHNYDMFEESHRVYLGKDGKLFIISSKSDLLNTLSDNKKQIKSFIKSKRLMVTKKDPRSFIPVVEYYESLQH